MEISMLSFKLIDGILKEPLGGAHNAPEEMAETSEESTFWANWPN